MRVAFVGGAGTLAQRVLMEIAETHALVAVADIGVGTADPSPIARLRRLAGRVIRRGASRHPQAVARAHGASWVPLRHQDDEVAWRSVAAARPDVLVTAGSPWIFSEDVLRLARTGAVNVHPALLPRHRGLLPYPWIYHHDDRESGVTAHLMTVGADEGPILAQHSFPVERGLPVRELDGRNAQLAPGVIRDALCALDSGERGTAQRRDLATRAPRVRPGDSLVRAANWPAERVWHVLSGLHPFFQEPLQTTSGAAFAYSAVVGFEVGVPAGLPGRVLLSGAEARLACADGWVRLVPA